MELELSNILPIEVEGVFDNVIPLTPVPPEFERVNKQTNKQIEELTI